MIEDYCKYVIVAGYMATAHGRSRSTEDINVIIEHLSEDEFKDLHHALQESRFTCRQSSNPSKLYNDYLTEDISIRYVREDTMLPELELRFAKDELDRYQLENRRKHPLTETDFYFTSPEANIAFKEELLRSDKDVEDTKHLRIIYGDELDKDEIERVKDAIRRGRL